MNANHKIKVFVSHSGVMGRSIAESFKHFLLDFDNSIFHIELAPRSISSGLGWFSEITKKLKESNICLCIVDRSFKESSWCSFEVGYFASIALESDTKNLFLVELPIPDINSQLRGLSHPLAQIQTKPFEKESFRELLSDCEKIYSKIYTGTTAPKTNSQLDSKWDEFESNVSNIIESYVGVNHDISFDKSVSITSDRANYLTEDLIDNIKYKLSDCLNTGFKNIGRNNLSKVFISFPLRLLNHLSLLLREAAGGTISITDQNFFETMWQDEIIDNVQKSIWTTNVIGSNARKLENIDAQQSTVNRLNEKGFEAKSFTRIFIIDPTKELQNELEELKKVIVEQAQIGINVGCILESDFKVFYHELYASVGGVDFMVLDEKFVYVTNTHTEKKSILSVKLLDNAQVPNAVRISNRINKSPKTKFYSKGNSIDSYFNDVLSVL